MQESGIMLSFWGNNEALTAAVGTNPSKRSRYSNRAVSNSNITVTKPLIQEKYLKQTIEWRQIYLRLKISLIV